MIYILIIDDFHEDLLSGLQTLNWKVSYYPNISPTEINQLEDEFDGLIIRSKTKVNKALLDHFSKLKFIARGGAGMDGIDTAECLKRSIQLFNAPEGNRDAVAEQTIAMVLGLKTKLVAANESVYNGVWNREKYRGSEIKNQTIGIIGFGNTGKEVARRWTSFGCKIICYDIDSEQYDLTLAEPVSLEYLQENADVISIHIPLLKPNIHFVNSHFISKIKSSSLLVNMSRGSILDTPKVLTLLAQNKFAGLALDVIEGEQKSAFPQLDIQSKMLLPKLRDKLIITPHIGGWTHESYHKIAKVILQKLTNYFEKKAYEKTNTN